MKQMVFEFGKSAKGVTQAQIEPVAPFAAEDFTNIGYSDTEIEAMTGVKARTYRPATKNKALPVEPGFVFAVAPELDKDLRF